MKTIYLLSLAFAGLCTAGALLWSADPAIVDSAVPRTTASARPPTSPASAPQRVPLDRSTAPAAVDRHAAQPAAHPAADLAITPWRTHPAADVLYETTNAAHGLHVGFTAKGIRVVTGSDGAELAMQLTGIGYGDRVQRVSDGSLYANGSRIDYHRTTANGAPFTEWYVNADDGVEHGFTLNAPIGAPRAGEPLVVQLDLAGDFVGEPTVAPDAIAFATHDGSSTLRYDGLYAYDANRRELPSYMDLAGDRLALVVDDSNASYPVTVDPKVKGGGNGGNWHANAEVREAIEGIPDGIQSDQGDGESVAVDDYVHNEDKLKVYASPIQITMGTKGIKNPRTAKFDFGTGRLLPRSSGQQYEGNHGDLPPGADGNGILVESVQFNTWSGHAYVRDATSPSGWKVGPDVAPANMAIDEVAYVALNVNLIHEGPHVTWRLAFGPGSWGPIRALDAQPVELIRKSETTFTIEARDLGKGVRAALCRKVADTNTFETIDHYDLPFKMTFVRQ